MCKRLTSLDSYIVSTCSHVICNACLRRGSGTSTTNNNNAVTVADWKPTHAASCLSCRNSSKEVTKLAEGQPLAHRVLGRVKVACPIGKRHNCTWVGDYKDLPSHINSHQQRNNMRRAQKKGNEMTQRATSSAVDEIPTMAKDINNNNNNIEGSTTVQVRTTSRRRSITQQDQEELGIREHNGMHDKLKMTAEKVEHHENDTSDQEGSKFPRGRWGMDLISKIALNTSDHTAKRPKSAMRRKMEHDNEDGLGTSDVRRVDQAAKSVSESLNASGSRLTLISRLPARRSSLNLGKSTATQKESTATEGIPVIRKQSFLRRSLNLENVPTTTQRDGASGPATAAAARASPHQSAGYRAFQAGKFQMAVDAFTDGIQAVMMPNTNVPCTQAEEQLASLLYSQRAHAHHRLGQFRDCITDCDDALKLDASNELAYVRKSKALVELRQFDMAHNCLSAGFGRIPTSLVLEGAMKDSYKLAKTMQHVDQYFNKEQYQKVLDATDNLGAFKLNRYVLVARAKAYLLLNLPDKAIEAANRVFGSDNQSVDALEIRAKARYMNGLLEDALMDCQTALSIHSSPRESINETYQTVRLVEQVYSEAKQAMRAGSFRQAVAAFGKAIQASQPLPKSTVLFRTLHAGRAEAHLHTKNYIQALANANTALESHPQYVRAWETKIKAMEALNRTKQLRNELSGIVAPGGWGFRNATLTEAYRRCNMSIDGSAGDSS
ncbi:hypothetical protein MHU86_22100 [Fragilaria crotonensis]|nr:hypothetical protein MHU86_22100 [Fragilaria crotonensis]